MAEQGHEHLFTAEIVGFVHEAVRLPHERLRKVDRQWDGLHAEQVIVTRLLQSGGNLREKVRALRGLIREKAELAVKAGDADESGMLVDEVVMAIYPTARALLLRSALESSPDPERSRAYTALTEPFRDLIG